MEHSNAATNNGVSGMGSSCPKNRWCVCCKYASPINVQALANKLKLYPDRNAAKILLDGFTFGFRLAYKGERSQRDSDNLKSISNLHDRALEKLEKEIKLGRMAGPFGSRPLSRLIVSPIGLVPKSQPGKYRLIQHLSFPHGSSINDGIDREMCTVKYNSFDVAITHAVGAGKGALMAKTDIESAFRLLPVHPHDFELLGIKVNGQYYVDKALPMGASCSPAHFERFSTFLEWAAIQSAPSCRITHFMDDYIIFAAKDAGKSRSCHDMLELFKGLCKDLGVPLAPDKTIGPTSKITYLGLQIDSESQTVSVPQEKLDKVKDKVQNAVTAEKLTLKELQSLIGSLSFICRAIAPGRAFLRRLIDLTCGVKHAWYKITLTKGAKADLRMWEIFLQHFNGVSIFSEQAWLGEDDLELFTDACKSVGFGGYFKGKWFRGKWKKSCAHYSIAWLEFFPILVAVVLWGDLLKGKRIILRSDNRSVIAIINRQTSRCPSIMKLVRFFVLQCLKHNIAFTARHIAGKHNSIADALSRFQEDRFRKTAPLADPHETEIPDFLWHL